MFLSFRLPLFQPYRMGRSKVSIHMNWLLCAQSDSIYTHTLSSSSLSPSLLHPFPTGTYFLYYTHNKHKRRSRDPLLALIRGSARRQHPARTSRRRRCHCRRNPPAITPTHSRSSRCNPSASFHLTRKITIPPPRAVPSPHLQNTRRTQPPPFPTYGWMT